MIASPTRKQLRDEAADHIRELIVAGQVRPGDRLPLAALAEQVNASITPIREALLLLAQDGWIVQEPNRGFRVAEIRRQDVEDAYLVHAYLAGELAARAAPKIDQAALDQLRALDSEIATLDGRDERRVEELNYAFHGVVYRVANAPRLIWFIRAAGRFVPRRFWATIPGWLELNRTGHAPIVKALAHGDAEEARRLMSEHIHHAGELLLAHLDASGFWHGHEADS
jgi:DNA-binding GntR family transcriptional regulator